MSLLFRPHQSVLSAAIAALLLSWHAQTQAQTNDSAPAKGKEESKPNAAQLAAQPATSGPEAATTPVVNVVSERQTNRIDRQVYDIKNDASTAGSSIGDVLNNVPSVNVDPNGTVRLRGSERVTVLVDGKPTAQMQGENRAAAINALPAENYESVQVINNPGAEFGNEAGGGPILNLISRRYTKPGGNGSVAGNLGPAGRKNAFANGSYSAGYASVNGSFNYRRDGNESEGDDVRERLDPASSSVSRLHQTSQRRGLTDFIQGGVGGRYNYNERDTLTASLSLNKRGNDFRSNEHLSDFGTGSVPLVDYLTRRVGSGDALNHEVVAGWERRFNTDGESLKVDLRHSSNNNNADTAALYQPVMLPATGAPVLRDYTQNLESLIRLTDLSSDYSGKVGSGFLTAGGRWQRTRQTTDYRYLFLDNGGLDTRRSNLFKLAQDVTAAYATYELPLNPLWSFKGGLRVEHTALDLDQVSTSVQASNSYTNYLPSLFLTYKLDQFSNLRLSYADRISRPAAGDLNPFVNYASEYSISSGNPHLLPVKLHSLELGYETKIKGLMPASLRGYLRHESDVITERRTFISPTTLLTTKENEGDRAAGGVEFSIMAMIPPNMKWNGISLPSIRFMFNGNWGFIEQDRLGLLGPTGEKRRTPSLGLQGGAQWSITPDDTLTFMTFRQGKQLSGEGYREPFSMVNLALEHKFSPRLSLNLRANDVFRGTDQRYRVDTDVLRDHNDVNVHQRRLYVGLRYTFGGVAGNDAVRNALQAAGVNPDSQVAKDAMRMMQGQQSKPEVTEKPAAEKKN
ncbi:outer membrane beta-barrel family protein [Duganella qianjiadongensis]|uniref:TonB-dependent receptor n=1 Tax=Duganella qianjiadongensis TaxID=2692176 RepID=A0ABW9VKM4_9BURK|nr:outer membrane beta-barrel family protein [Duganella qianjiadongensis]MYM39465.1 TonB-dependent receptor [Duganella qianjiadongensis]